MSIYEIDWDEEFGRNKPATPRPPCDGCGERESLGECSHCYAPLCDDCADYHLEGHEENRARELIADLERRGFVIRLSPDGLRVIPVDQLTADDNMAIRQVMGALARLVVRTPSPAREATMNCDIKIRKSGGD